ncbi:hypothetical protein ACQV2S_06875 [Facklamia sp. P13064]|uniref:hypothetical protein n=1 Tax=Facklamia sp. P13064 TaxID=3421953 RepID=UPI003D186FD3
MNELELTLKTNQLVEIYSEFSNKNEEYFSLGYLIAIEDDFSTLISINEYGMIESFQYRKNAFISNNVSSTCYLKNFKKIIDYNKSINLYDPYSLTKDYEQQFQGKDPINEPILVNKQVSIITTENDFILQGRIIEKTKESFVLSSSTIDDLTENQLYEIKHEDIVLIDLLSIDNKLIEQIK